MAFVSIGVFYGFLERRLWERMQYLRRLFMNSIAETKCDGQKAEFTFGCIRELDYKLFDTSVLSYKFVGKKF
jgi:hypothetical protein